MLLSEARLLCNGAHCCSNHRLAFLIIHIKLVTTCIAQRSQSQQHAGQLAYTNDPNVGEAPVQGCIYVARTIFEHHRQD